MTLKEYFEWLKSKGIEEDDTLLFVQDDGSGYTTELSDVPKVADFAEDRYGSRRKFSWKNNPKWVLGAGTT